MHKETAHNKEMGINTKFLQQWRGEGVVRWTICATTWVRHLSTFFSLRNLFIFCGLTKNCLFIRARGRVGVIEYTKNSLLARQAFLGRIGLLLLLKTVASKHKIAVAVYYY